MPQPVDRQPRDVAAVVQAGDHAARRPYGEWLRQQRIDLNDLHPEARPHGFNRQTLLERMQARRLPDDPFTRVEQDEVLLDLFPVLLRQDPAVALRLLAETVPENWCRPIALLSSRVTPACRRVMSGRVSRCQRAVFT